MNSQSARIVVRRSEIDDSGSLSPRSVSMRYSSNATLEVITKIDSPLPHQPSSMSSSPLKNRARDFKAQFIEVYMGTHVFGGAGLNAIVAIYLQASDRLYEVVLINKDTAEEISRLYVYENELSEQMDLRSAALTALCETHTDSGIQQPHRSRGSISMQSKNSSNSSSTKSSPHPHPTASSPSKQTLEKLGPDKHSSSNKFMDINCQRNDELKDEELRRIIDFNINDSHVMSKAPRVAKPMSYFGLMAGTETSPSVTDRHRKVGITQLLQDLTLREADLSASAARDISFFTAVIRTSLYVRLKARSDDRRPFQFILFDGGSNRVFSFVYKLPQQCSEFSAPTDIDLQAIIAKMEYNDNLKSDINDMSSVHHLLQSANALHDETDNKLHMLHDLREQRVHSDNINPNTNRYRSMWQAAFIAVSSKLRHEKHQRSEWDRVIGLRKRQIEQEAMLLHHSRTGKFRALASEKEGSDPMDMTIDDVNNYRRVLTIKKRKSSFLKHTVVNRSKACY